MRGLFSCLLSGVVFVAAVPAFAGPIVSVDADPTTVGIQSNLDVLLGDSFSVDIFVDGVEAAEPLQAFEFDLGFNPMLLNATGVGEGGFLTGPFGTLVFEQDIAPPDVNFAVTALGPSTTSGSGVLATVAFDAIGVGSATLDLTNVLLATVSGPGVVQPIILDGVFGATISVKTAAVPEPSTAFLLATGLIGLLGKRCVWRTAERTAVKGRRTVQPK